MSYIDALFDREHDRIHVVGRRNGERYYQEYAANYVMYYDDPRGKFRSIYGTSVSRFSTRNSKEFRKEQRIQSGKNLYEADINPVFRCLEENYKGKDAPRLHTAFFDIEVAFDAERGFSMLEVMISMFILATGVFLRLAKRVQAGYRCRVLLPC